MLIIRKIYVKLMEFINLKKQFKKIKPNVERRIFSILDKTNFILGEEVQELENKLSKFSNIKHSITCANGTDAIILSMMALGVKKGDVVFCPSFTYAATAEAIVLSGATPFFVDIDEASYNLDITSLKDAIEVSKKKKYKISGIVSVDLFGNMANHTAINKIAKENNIWHVADKAQSFGAYYKNKEISQLFDIATTSFFPAKPLGCYGDGGAIFTSNDKLAEILKSLRVHGKGQNKYDNVRIGMNSRLDTIQAGILIEKLKLFPNEIILRQRKQIFIMNIYQKSI